MTPFAIDTTQRRSTEALTILQRAVCLTLERHYLGNDRKVPLSKVVDAATKTMRAEAAAAFSDQPAEVQMDVDEKQFRTTMKLIDQKELRPCNSIMTMAETILKKRAISAHRIFGKSTYLIPADAVEEIDAALTKLQQDLALEAEKLADRVEAAIEAQAKAHGELFDRSRYWTRDQVVGAWSIDWSYVSFAAPDRLEHISSTLARKADRKYQQKLASAFDEVVLSMRSEAVGILGELESKLSPDEDGAPKIIRGTVLRDIEQYLQTLPSRDLTDDGELRAALQKVKDRAVGLKPEDLRDNAALRDSLRAIAAEAKAKIAGLVEGHKRAISFEDF